VPRQGLVERAEASLATPVIVVSAGPGWGKTTLLAQWASQSHRPFGWVHVDERDNDPIVLLTYVAVALDRISPLDPSVFGALASPGVSVEATVVPRVGAALATMGREVVLVLDDLHVLENPVCLDAVASLTTHVSPGSHIALSARGEPALPLGALRAKGLALEIGPDELRMDEAEASASQRGRSEPAGRPDRRPERADGGLERGPVSRCAVDPRPRHRGHGRGDVLRS
jgi:LuxR family maltose regulon positive regulatory protein